ncbi:nwd2 [Moniliophthora roreri MCA 2997]|uniref:Nwd2 n=1 Tax=Moniliophthora roreri (strain MCA 2997) TaxID=1381753 RepID=V2WNI3_MONRO|nr:nwd2 [Moniliophthora roreri MCA 2997]
MSPQHRPFPISCSSSDKHFSNDDDSTSARSAGYSRNKYDTVNIGSYNTTNNGCHIGDMYYIQRHESDVIETKLINLLREYTALKAAYNSGSREPHPEIYPDIRVDVLNRIRDWITKPNLEKDDNIFILHGPIGVSKSAIAQAISTEYGNYKKLAASFFFWRNDHDRNNLRTFVPTLAYQIAQCKPLAPLLKKHIAQAVEDDALLRNLKIQFRELVVNPCLQVPSSKWADLPRLMVVDGVSMNARKKRMPSVSCPSSGKQSLPIPHSHFYPFGMSYTPRC